MDALIKNKKGFTLIELLVVIAIIALLLAILAPSLNAVKELASGAVCLSNQKSLCTAWMLYAEEYNSKMVGGSTYDSGSKPTPYRWVEPPLLNPVYGSTRAPLNAQLTREQRINGIRAGRLFTYLENEEVYHCPGDKTSVKNEEPLAVYRSYAITGLMNGEDFISRSSSKGAITQFRSVTLYGTVKVLKVALKTTEIRTPGNKYVFVEEDVVKGKIPSHQQEYNKGGFVLLKNGMTWWDAPAGFHNEGSTIGFADGHSEKRKWRDKDTIALIEDAIYDPDPANNADLQWLVRGYIPR